MLKTSLVTIFYDNEIITTTGAKAKNIMLDLIAKGYKPEAWNYGVLVGWINGKNELQIEPTETKTQSKRALKRLMDNLTSSDIVEPQAK